MRKILLAMVGALLVSQTYSQDKCQIKGNIVDQNGEALQFATVQIINISNGVVKGVVTDSYGYFCDENMVKGRYKIKITYIGFETFESDVFEIKNGDTYTFNDISLVSNNTQLSEVIVIGSAIVSEIKPTTIKYKANALVSQQGGSVGDILKNMPSVSMGGSPGHNRDIRFRGLGNAYTKVLINGKESGLKGNNLETVLDQIPASSIESIEILSVPSAEYSSEGINGIVNITLKENKFYGTSGSAQILAGNFNGLQGEVGLSHKTSKYSIFGQYDFQQRTLPKEKTEFKTNFNNVNITGYDEKVEFEEKSFNNHFLRTGFEFNPLPKTFFRAEYIYGYQLEEKSKNTIITKQNADGSFKSAQQEKKPELNPNTYQQIVTSIVHTWKNRSVKADFSYMNSLQKLEDYKSLYNIDETGRLLDFQPKLENKNESKMVDDYNWNVSINDIKIYDHNIKLGYSGKYEVSDFRLSVDKYNYSDTLWITQASGFDNFNLTYENHAFFISDEFSFDFLRAKAGLRYEYSELVGHAEGNVYNGKGANNILLPNLSLTLNIDKTQYFSVNFGRRIRRPGYKDLNPYLEEKNPGEFKQGNPDLMPETAWAYEVGYFKNFKRFNFGTNVFYRDINDVIQKNITEDNLGNRTETPQNTGHAKLMGVEFMSAVKPFRFWEFNANYSIFHSEITSGEYQGDALKDQFKWSAKVINDFKLPYSTKIQFAFNAIGPKISNEKEENTIWFADLGIEKNITDKGSIIFRVSDLLNSLEKEKIEITDKSTTRAIETTEGRIFMLGLKYNF
ncbi:TonB-dependent receptor [Tenuifilum osseticum]|uniref:TonB-dependent receptor n=1 Tax=Tenuifilum osseticum TaxID=3374723 RepID=UPI0034E44B26